MKGPYMCSTERCFFSNSDPNAPHKRPPNTLGMEENYILPWNTEARSSAFGICKCCNEIGGNRWCPLVDLWPRTLDGDIDDPNSLRHPAASQRTWSTGLARFRGIGTEMQIGIVETLLQRAPSQMDATPQLDCLNHLLQRDCRLHSEMAIENWPRESRPACARNGWVRELLQQRDVVHSRPVRTGSPTLHSGNPTLMAEHTFLVEGLRDGHHQPQKTNTAGLARHDTGEKLAENAARKSTIAAACVIQHCCCAGGTALRSPVENGATPRGRSTTTNARDMIGQNNHDCGFCPGTVLGNFTTCTMDPNWQVGHARTTSDEFPEENRTQRVPDIPCTNSTSHSIENPPPHGMDHHTLHTAPVGNTGCHLLALCENMRHRSTANPKQTSTVATLVGRRLVRTVVEDPHGNNTTTTCSAVDSGCVQNGHLVPQALQYRARQPTWTSCLRHGTATPSSPIESKHNTQLTSGCEPTPHRLDHDVLESETQGNMRTCIMPHGRLKKDLGHHSQGKMNFRCARECNGDPWNNTGMASMSSSTHIRCFKLSQHGMGTNELRRSSPPHTAHTAADCELSVSSSNAMGTLSPR